jgi:hypothetical protein
MQCDQKTGIQPERVDFFARLGDMFGTSHLIVNAFLVPIAKATWTSGKRAFSADGAI